MAAGARGRAALHRRRRRGSGGPDGAHGGGTQVTLSGKPLYRFSGDVDPGDVNGQGVDGTWFAVRPSGERAEDLPYGAEDGTGGPRGD